MKAGWNGKIIASSDEIIMVENNAYFPSESVNMDYLEESSTHTFCHWKGKASYYHIVVDGKKIEDAAWYYPEPKEEAKQIKNKIAFWKQVEVIES